MNPAHASSANKQTKKPNLFLLLKRKGIKKERGGTEKKKEKEKELPHLSAAVSTPWVLCGPKGTASWEPR